jgi:hypothetical protein
MEIIIIRRKMIFKLNYFEFFFPNNKFIIEIE